MCGLYIYIYIRYACELLRCSVGILTFIYRYIQVCIHVLLTYVVLMCVIRILYDVIRIYSIHISYIDVIHMLLHCYTDMFQLHTHTHLYIHTHYVCTHDFVCCAYVCNNAYIYIYTYIYNITI